MTSMQKLEAQLNGLFVEQLRDTSSVQNKTPNEVVQW